MVRQQSLHRNRQTLPARRRGLTVLATLSVAALLFAQACGSGTPGDVTETVPATPIPTPTEQRPAPTLGPVTAVSLDERATFYGAEAGDGAMSLAAGDFNGDSFADLVLAAAGADGPGNSRADGGEAYVFLGPLLPGRSYDAALNDQQVTIFGASSGDQLGRAIVAADVNGDGMDDIVLGAPFADGMDGQRPDAGAAYVILGARALPSAIDLAADPAASVVLGADESDLSGFSLAAPDANGDGVADVLIGAFWGDGPDNARPDAGEAYLIFGSESWPTAIDLAKGDQDATVYGAEADDKLAEALAAGDVNADGTQDLVIPAPFASGPGNERPDAGEVYVILGGDLRDMYDLASATPAMTVLGNDSGDQIGHSAAVGDFDGAGAGDLLLGAVSADGPDNMLDLAGEAYTVRGAASGLADTRSGAEALRAIGADATDRLGRSVASGDLNGDGITDILLAASGGDGRDGSIEDGGEVNVIFGRSGLRGLLNLAGQAADIVIFGLDPDDVLGADVVGRPSLLTADIDGDGLADVLVSALGDGPENSRADAGEAYVLFARP